LRYLRFKKSKIGYEADLEVQGSKFRVYPYEARIKQKDKIEHG
jgi:hypothetical protein